MTSLAVLFVASAILEVGGIIMIVLDVREDRGRARRLIAERPTEVYARSRIRYRGMPEERRREQESRRLKALQRNAKAADEFILRTLHDVLRGNLYRRLIGPAMIAAGLVVALAANLLALR